MNKIAIIKELYPYEKESKGLIIIVRRFELPITPFVGLTLADVEGVWCVELTKITYDIKKMEWVCYTEPNRGFMEPTEEGRALGIFPNRDSVLNSYLVRGWQETYPTAKTTEAS